MKLTITSPSGARQVVQYEAGSRVEIAPDNVAANDPRLVWETTPSTTPPLEVAMLEGIVGPGGDETVRRIREYHKWYHERYGWQCTLPGAPHNAEDHDKCEFRDIANAWRPPVIVPGV